MKPHDLRVLHSFPIWLPQTQTWMYSQVRELQRLGVQAHVACEQLNNLEQFRVEHIHSLSGEARWRQTLDKSLRKLRLRRYLQHTVRTARATQAQVLHSHFGNIGWQDLGAARRAGTRHVVTFYGLDVNMLPQSPQWRRRYRDLFAQADRFLCEGPHMAACLVALGCPAHKVLVHHLGIDPSAIAFRPRAWRPGEPLKVLLAATFREKKGLPIALRMLGRLQERMPLEITLIGDATPDERSQREKVAVLQALRDTRLEDRVRMLGFRPHAVFFEEAYRHHLFVSPSVTSSDGDTEGGAPMAILEAMATGMPVVSTTHCDIPEVMRPQAARFLAPERNVDALLERALHTIEHWDEMEEAMRSLRHYAETEYDQVAQGEKLARIYADVMDSR